LLLQIMRAAQRILDTTARMASRTEEFFILPPPVGAGIQSRGVKGARPWNFQARLNTTKLTAKSVYSAATSLSHGVTSPAQIDG